MPFYFTASVCIKCAVTIRDTALRITCLRAALGRTMFGISAREDDMDIIETYRTEAEAQAFVARFASATHRAGCFRLITGRWAAYIVPRS